MIGALWHLDKDRGVYTAILDGWLLNVWQGRGGGWCWSVEDGSGAGTEGVAWTLDEAAAMAVAHVQN